MDIAIPFKKKFELMGNLNRERMLKMKDRNMGF